MDKRVVTLRHVTERATEYGLQQYGDPIPVDVELEGSERIIGFESFHSLRSLSDMALMVRIWIEAPK
jgi:hypothetical protein